VLTCFRKNDIKDFFGSLKPLNSPEPLQERHSFSEKNEKIIEKKQEKEYF